MRLHGGPLRTGSMLPSTTFAEALLWYIYQVYVIFYNLSQSLPGLHTTKAQGTLGGYFVMALHHLLAGRSPKKCSIIIYVYKNVIRAISQRARKIGCFWPRKLKCN